MATHVDKLSIKVEKFSPKIYVHSFELAVALNDIPKIQLNVLPVERSASAKKGRITASSPDIAEITALYNKLTGDALKNNVTATITIEMKGKLKSDERNQKITLKDWILTDVGLSTVTCVAAPVLTVVFSHPVAKLDKTGSIHERVRNPKRLPPMYRDTPGSDVIEYMNNLYDLFAKPTIVEYYPIASLSEGGPSPEFQNKIVSLREELSEYKPGKYIKGNTGGKLFLEYLRDDASGEIRTSLGNIVAPKAFGKSTWQKLVADVCSTQLAQIVPTYDKEKLLLEPCSPWQAPSYTLNTPIIQGMDMVSVDPAPIIGVAMEKDIVVEERLYIHREHRNTKGDTDKSKIKDYSYGFYFPDKALGPDVIGEISHLAENEIISSITINDLNANADPKIQSALGSTIEETKNSITDTTHMLFDEAYVNAMFLINYRKYCRASVTAIPIFKDSKGKTIYPGRVLTVVDKSTNKKLFNGYVTRLLIRGSMDGGGTTYIDLSHARPPSNSTLVEEGTENPCYPPITRNS